jgi:Trk K+ transport system NAD-binding subunit/Kef-type K+ transport system membrane component KefB
MTILYLVSFAILAISSRQIGWLFSRVRLPLITGYLLTGVLIGPFGLQLLPADAVGRLRFVDEIALAVIAFAAGSELYLSEMRSRLRSIAWVTTGLILATFVLGTLSLLLLADHVPFLRDLPGKGRLVVAMLGGTILVARSPSSAIAVVNELRAKGPFTKTVLGVTVVMDVAVISLFALNSSLADAVLADIGLDLGFLVLLVVELTLSLGVGVMTAWILRSILSLQLPRRVKILVILLAGYAVFGASVQIRQLSAVHLHHELLLEPLLICMIASFVVTNTTKYRIEFTGILEAVGPPVYVAFFTLTGASLALDVLAAIWPMTLVLVVVRLAGIVAGSFVGGVIAKDPMRHNRVAWMAYLTQAGVGLGLAKEVADEFPEIGAAFTTMFVSVIVWNQLLGPPFFKAAIKRVRESHLPALAHPDAIRDALILGIEGQSLALARQLRAHGWKVIVADTDAASIERITDADLDRRHLPSITRESLAEMVTSATDALVAMLDDDEANLRVCELAYENFGIPRLIVRATDPILTRRFRSLGALVVDPASAMVNLLDRFVRAPRAALLFQANVQHDTVDVTITDMDLVGLSLRDLRLPDDVLVLGIHRRKHWVVPHGYTRLRLNDDVTLMGSAESLQEVTRRFGY